MTAYILRRLIQLPLILLVIYTVTFALISMHGGNPFVGDKTPAENKKLIAERYGVIIRSPEELKDQTFAQRWADNGRMYWGFLSRLVVHGDLGLSSQFEDMTVSEIIGHALPRSLLLGAFALCLSVLVGCTLGILAGVYSHGPIDYLVTVYALIGISLPLFVIGAVLLWMFAFAWPLFPVGGWGSPSQLVLPGVALSLPFTAYIGRLMRAGMLDVLSQDHIRTARAKGLPGSQVVLKHAFKQAFLPVMSFLGPATASILTGSFVVEQIFDVPGIGRAFVDSVTSKDYALILGTVLIYSTLLIVANLIVDLAYHWLDPRIHLEGQP
ncbi:MAG: Dipeptide transport system permease protein DppB [Phycisphaerae bacterium]|nr:Dipeptide transport system permease protein DppB [Phycisphaerae bacterium]